MKYELVIIWDTGERETALYNTLEKAEKVEKGFYMAFGKQIAFTCINEKRGCDHGSKN